MPKPPLESITGQNRPGRGRPRDVSKTKAILRAASDLFLEAGFDGASMDGVARRAGVSKQTVYSHFESKEQLFGDAIHTAIASYLPDRALAGLETHTLEDDLRAICHTLASLWVDERAIAMFRLLVAAGAKGASLGELFWRSGPAELHDQLVRFLKQWGATGGLLIGDYDKAARQLVTFVKEPAHFRIAIGVQAPLNQQEINAVVDDAVADFLKLYAP